MLNRAGVPVSVVSAIELPRGAHEQQILDEIADLTDSTGAHLEFAAVRFVYYPKNPKEEQIRQAGIDKAVAMKKLGASILFDDSAIVCEAVRSVGLLAINHRPERPVR